MELKDYAFIPMIAALVASLFYGIQPDPTHYCENEMTQRYCFDISGGLHTRCYIVKDKSSWDYCKSGWQPIAKYVPKTIDANTDIKVVDNKVEVWRLEKTYTEYEIAKKISILYNELESIESNYEEYHDMCISGCPVRCEYEHEIRKAPKNCISLCESFCNAEMDYFGEVYESKKDRIENEIDKLRDMEGLILEPIKSL